MIVKNLTRKTIIAKDLKEAKTWEDLTLGLLKKTNPRSLMFKINSGIHTFGLKEAIDVTVIDQQNKVRKLAVVKPNSVFFWNPKYNLILELPKGTIQKSKTKLSDLLSFGI